MSTAALISVADYLANPDKPYPEYINGALRPRSMPTRTHGFIQFLLVMLLRRQNLEAYAEVRVQLSPTRFLIPDVIADKTFEGECPTRPAMLCVEVLSPDDALGSVFAKCDEYRMWGTPYCWVIDPIQQVAWQYHPGSAPVAITRAETLRAGQIAVSMEELFGAVDAEIGRSL